MSHRFKTLKVDFKTKVRNSGFKNLLPLEDLPTSIYHLTVSRKNNAEKKRKEKETEKEAVSNGTNNSSVQGKEMVKKLKISRFGGIVGFLLQRHEDQMEKIRWMLDTKTWKI